MRVPVAGAVQQAQDQVEQKARDDTERDLYGDDREHTARRLLMGHEHRDHLVGCGKNDGHKRTGRDHAPREECGRHGREAALRQGTKKPTHHRAGGTGALNRLFDFIAGKVLECLHGQIGDEEERNEFEGVDYRVGKHVENQIHCRSFPCAEYVRVSGDSDRQKRLLNQAS